jgi:hypothetical protein
MRTCPTPGTVIFLSTNEKTPGEDISTALYVLPIFILQVRVPFSPKSVRSSALGLSDSEVLPCECNDWAILNSLKKCDLGSPPILNFEEFLLGEENAVDWQISTSSMGRNFEGSTR